MYPGVTKPSDEAVYRWLLDRAHGGDVVVLTADPLDTPCDLYNPFLFNMTGLAHRPRSVSTVCFRNREDSFDPHTAGLLEGAAMVFMTGGDQAKYYDFWRDSPVSRLLVDVPVVGGSSAGLAVQGEVVFDAQNGSVVSEDALLKPLDAGITLADDLFRSLPYMGGVLTDTHFLQRDRMGRAVAFLAVAAHNGWGGAPDSRRIGAPAQDAVGSGSARGSTAAASGVVGGGGSTSTKGLLAVAVSEHTAVLVDTSTGDADVTGDGPAYFVHPPRGAMPQRLAHGESLTFTNLTVHKWNGSGSFSMSTWTPHGLAQYELSAVKGVLHSSSGRIY